MAVQHRPKNDCGTCATVGEPVHILIDLSTPLNHQFTFAPGHGIGRLSVRSGHRRLLPFAFSHGRAGQPTRLRRDRPGPDQPRDRDAGRLQRFAEPLRQRGMGVDCRRRPQSHVHRRPGQRVVVGRPGKRPQFPVCPLLRYRLESAEERSCQQSATADSGRSIWTDSGRPTDHRAV